MTFFQDFPVPPTPPRGRAVRYVPPARAGAPTSFRPSSISVSSCTGARRW